MQSNAFLQEDYGKPQIEKTSHLAEAYEFGKTINLMLMYAKCHKAMLCQGLQSLCDA